MLHTCPTFKGLEADDVIVIDVNNDTFAEGNCDFYVATSRAKKRLYVFVDRDKVDLVKILGERFPDSFPLPDKAKQLALILQFILLHDRSEGVAFWKWLWFKRIQNLKI